MREVHSTAGVHYIDLPLGVGRRGKNHAAGHIDVCCKNRCIIPLNLCAVGCGVSCEDYKWAGCRLEEGAAGGAFNTLFILRG